MADRHKRVKASSEAKAGKATSRVRVGESRNFGGLSRKEVARRGLGADSRRRRRRTFDANTYCGRHGKIMTHGRDILLAGA